MEPREAEGGAGTVGPPDRRPSESASAPASAAHWKLQGRGRGPARKRAGGVTVGAWPGSGAQAPSGGVVLSGHGGHILR